MMNNSDWRVQHRNVIIDFLEFLNKRTDQFVLKGGTALMLCYGLNRFSEDIDLDGRKQSIKEVVRQFCRIKNFLFSIKKDTPTVCRCMIDYGNAQHPLKIEVSYRNQCLNDQFIDKINGVCVYTIDRLALMKASAYQNRDRLRDLYDLCFICNHYFDKLDDQVKNAVIDAVSNKGLDQFDYLLETQADPLIDSDLLASSFLEMNDRLGLLLDHDDDLISKNAPERPEVQFDDLESEKRRADERSGGR